MDWFKSLNSLVQVKELSESERSEEIEGLVRPSWNGRLLSNPAGTVWQVIDGKARGFVSEGLFLRLHYWSRTVRSGNCGSWWPPQASICTTSVHATAITLVPNLQAFIAEAPPFDSSIRLISNPAGMVCLYESNVKRCVPNPSVMEYYQFDWDKVTVLNDEVFNAIPVGTNLTIPT